MASKKNNYLEDVQSRKFKIEQMPFSRFGSYLVIDQIPHMGKNALFIRDVHGGDLDPGCQFLIDVQIEEKSIKRSQLKFEMTATELVIINRADPQQKLRFCMPLPGQVRIKGEGLDLRLVYQHKRYDSIYPLEDGSYELTSYSKERKYRIRDYKDKVKVGAKWERIGSDHIELLWTGEFDSLIDTYKVIEDKNQRTFKAYEEGLAHVQNDYKQWVEKVEKSFSKDLYKHQSLGVQKRIAEAGYILWMNFVKPEGILKRPAMYMTKHYMTNIWSWDNCFGAIALASIDSELAWDQLMMFADHQHESGAYPDYANDQYASFSCVKPPIYVWAYKLMCECNSTFEETCYLKPFYETTAKNTRFWLEERMSLLGLPCYRHGNDSGWDNGTYYQKGVPVITPDLTAFLIYQLEGLEEMAYRLDLWEEAEGWRTKAERLYEKLAHMLWLDHKQKFAAIHVPDCTMVDEGDSLQGFLTLIVAHRLPDMIKNALVIGLKDEQRFLGDYGLATEAMNSSFYQYNGYWRGPIWAPVTLIMVDVVKKLGEKELADTIRQKWIKLIEKSGFYENFDPKTGEGLVDPAFAWTASVFLHLLNEPNSCYSSNSVATE